MQSNKVNSPLGIFWAIVCVFVVATAASTIQRVSGFGAGIFAMIFLPYIVGNFGQANALSGILSVVSTIIVASTMFRYIKWKVIIFPIIAYTVFTIPAVIFLKNAPAKMLFIMLGAFLIILSIYFFFFSSKVRISPTWYGGLIAGSLSGVMGGLFGMGGPPVAVYFLQTSNNDNNAYIATIQMFFLMSNSIGTAVKAINGLVTPDVLILAIPGGAGMVAGIFIGKLIFNKLNPAMLRKVVYGFMAISGAYNLVTAILK